MNARALLLGLLAAAPSFAQAPPLAPAADEPCRTPPEAPIAARVGTQDVLLSEVDGALGEALEELRATLLSARLEALENAVDERVLAREAAERRLEPAALLARELEGKWKLPTVEDARALYEANKAELVGGFALHQQALLEELTRRREAEARIALLAAWRPRHAVRPLAEAALLADPRLAPTTAVAEVAGARITLAEVDAPIQPMPRLMEEELYEQRRRKLDELVRARIALLPAGAPAPTIEIRLLAPRAGDARLAGGEQPALGPADAPVTLVLFLDFECANCAKLHELLVALRASHERELRVVFRDFPIREHLQAVPAALAAEAAREQGRYFEYAARLLRNQVGFGAETYARHARELGLDRARFERVASSASARAEVERDRQDALAVNVFSTPTVFVNGRRVVEHTREALEDAIAGALRERAEAPKR
ncbi:MAG: thioredoxin domain-containing protein [Planctomycetes bacterium]|nr:thioredoxin domain-containing protein [Planctomycetota bacterium]